MWSPTLPKPASDFPCFLPTRATDVTFPAGVSRLARGQLLAEQLIRLLPTPPPGLGTWSCQTREDIFPASLPLFFVSAVSSIPVFTDLFLASKHLLGWKKINAARLSKREHVCPKDFLRLRCRCRWHFFWQNGCFTQHFIHGGDTRTTRRSQITSNLLLFFRS